MVKSGPRQYHDGNTSPLVALAAVAGLLVSGVSGAATWSERDCKDGLHEATLDSDHFEELVLTPIDHGNLDTVVENPVEADDDQSTPFLYLSPRVANVLRDVFAVADEEEAVAEADGSVSAAETVEDIDAASLEIDEETMTPPVSSDVEVIPLIQRQMYRIDI